MSMESPQFSDFKQSVQGPAPADTLSPALQALWYAAKGDWERAHELAQSDPSQEGSWVHAYLHRVEGDLSNAGYWYRLAGRDKPDGSLDEEWTEIAKALT